MDPKLAAQHQTNLAAIETERQASHDLNITNRNLGQFEVGAPAAAE